jgi:hypothetical protein
MLNFPSKSPKAKHVWEEGEAANDPDLIPRLFSMVEITFSYPFVNCVISMSPVARGRSPHTTNLLESGIHLTS